MAFSTYAAYKAALDAPYQRITISKALSTSRINRIYSLWNQGVGVPGQGIPPTTAATQVNDTAGALLQADSSGTQRILRMVLCSASGQMGTVTVADRLSHQGGLSGTAAGAQTTNLPTAALTRKTTGIGVQAAVEIYTTLGATAATATVSYTNEIPTSGQVSPAFTIGTSDDYRELGRFLHIPLAVGDRGVRAVASITLSGTTGTTGNFGITLFYPLITVPYHYA